MSKTYIRIYCNDFKVRSTGNRSWYRKKVLDELLLDKDLNMIIPYPISEEKAIILSERLKNYAFNVPTYEENVFKVELVRSTNNGKKILKSIVLPIILRSTGEFVFYEKVNIKGERYG